MKVMLGMTLHRLGLAEEPRLSFATTNVIESVQAHVGRLTDHVDRYRTSEQNQRWVGAALLEIEPQLRPNRDAPHGLPRQQAVRMRGHRCHRERGGTKR